MEHNRLRAPSQQWHCGSFHNRKEVQLQVKTSQSQSWDPHMKCVVPRELGVLSSVQELPPCQLQGRVVSFHLTQVSGRPALGQPPGYQPRGFGHQNSACEGWSSGFQ